MHLIKAQLYFSCIIGMVIGISRDSPDVRLVQGIVSYMWKHGEDIIESTIFELGFDREVLDMMNLPESEELDNDATPEEYISCAECLTFVGGLQGLISAGLTFDDVRDAAVEICYIVTVAIGFNGTVVCPGTIDNFGPHVYYVLNTTDMSAREICEFHNQCSPVNRTESRDPLFARAEKVLPAKSDNPRARPAKQDMLRIAQITDVHYDVKYATGSPTSCDLPLCCRDYWEGTGIANEWGEYTCAVPVRTVEVMLQAMADLQPHILLNTGDTPPHALWEETQMGQIDYSRWLIEAIQRYMPGIEAYTCIGNHDTYPTNLYFAERPQIQALNRNLTEMYEAVSTWTEEARETMEIAGYYTMPLRPGLKIMAINSNYGYDDNFYGVLLPDSEEWRLHSEYIENAFIEARENNEMILLLGHHTIGGGFDFYVEWINLMMETYGDVILFQVQGHSHDDYFQLSCDEDLVSTSLMLTCSTMGTSSYQSPTFRIFYLDPETYTPLEYDHYFINMTATQNGVEPTVELMYNSFADYGLQDLTIASYEDFITRMETDDDLYYLYKWTEEGRVAGREPGPCFGPCRRAFSCDRRTSSPGRYEQCMEASK